MYSSLCSVLKTFIIKGKFSKAPSATSDISYKKWNKTGNKSYSVSSGPSISAHSWIE